MLFCDDQGVDIGEASLRPEDILGANTQEVLDVSDLHAIDAGEHEVLIRIAQYALEI
jgi:hypothetical protein